jgi:biotin carboxyl carrier protein
LNGTEKMKEFAMRKFFLSFLFLTGFTVYTYSAIPVNVMDLEIITPAKTFYTGKIEAIEKGNFSFDIEGKLEYVKNVGEYVFEKIYDEETKKVIRKGTIVASYYKIRQRFALKEAMMSKKIAEAELEKAKINFERYKTLIDKKAVSAKDFLEVTTNFMNAKLQVSKAENNLEIAKYNLDACEIIAPFSGTVSKSFVSSGAHIGKGSDVIELTKMTPILVKIPFPEEIVSSFRDGAKVDIYPVNGGVPVNAWCRTGLTDNMLYAYIENTIVGQREISKKTKYQKIYEIFPVKNSSLSNHILNELGDIEMNYENNKNPLAVPIKSIKKDKKGSYVLKGDYAGKYKNLSMFKLSRVDIVPGGIKRNFNLGSNRVSS